MVDLFDVQGIVASAYGRLPYAWFVFLRIEERAPTQEWLRGVVGEITSAGSWRADERRPPSSAHIAFTAPGLAQLGLSGEAMQSFPREFLVGMADPGRSRVLGDTGDCAPEFWQVGGSEASTPHLILLVFAASRSLLDEETSRLWNPEAPAAGLREIFRQYSFRKDGTEPFGFSDGISQPAVEGITRAAKPGQDIVKTGEFLLGYENEYSQATPTVTVPAAEDKAGVLPACNGTNAQKDFGRNGTFLIWRKLVQDVDGFWQYMDRQTRNTDGTANEDQQKRLAAKFMGRWMSGAPLTLAPEYDDPELGADDQRNNNFMFMPTDAAGQACPIGSHMRRANPRDSLQPNPSRSQVIVSRHRLIRRGRPFEDSMPDGSVARGMIFVAMNANLQQQFEFIQQTWINTPKMEGLYDNKDPVVGDNDGNGTMTIQGYPVGQQVHGLSRFVKVLGGGYFFLPGLSAVRFLAGVREPSGLLF